MKKILISIFCVLISFNSFSSHLMGGEITWECLKSGPDVGKYVFTITISTYLLTLNTILN